jgi:hypothetical protein
MLLTEGNDEQQVRAAIRRPQRDAGKRGSLPSGHPTQAAAQAAKVDHQTLGQQRGHEDEASGTEYQREHRSMKLMNSADSAAKVRL